MGAGDHVVRTSVLIPWLLMVGGWGVTYGAAGPGSVAQSSPSLASGTYDAGEFLQVGSRRIPLLQGQHYRYLKRQFDHIRTGLRRNADRKMSKQIKGFDLTQEAAVLSYTAGLRPPPEKLAAPGWLNRDFPLYPRASEH